MTTLDLVGAGGWAAMSLAFVASRSRVFLFNVVCGVSWLAAFAACWSGSETTRLADATALLAGLIFYWCGLVMLRAMLTRSVSLHLLVAYSRPRDDDAFDERIAGRLDEAVKFGLVRSDGARLALSPAGSTLAAVLVRLYRAAGLD